MKVKALRGVCVGVEDHLAAGEERDLDPGLVNYLEGIGAVERVKDAPTPQPELEIEPAPEKKSGKKEK